MSKEDLSDESNMVDDFDFLSRGDVKVIVQNKNYKIPQKDLKSEWSIYLNRLISKNGNIYTYDTGMKITTNQDIKYLICITSDDDSLYLLKNIYKINENIVIPIIHSQDKNINLPYKLGNLYFINSYRLNISIIQPF